MGRLRPWLTLARVSIRPLDASSVATDLNNSVSTRVATRQDLMRAAQDTSIDFDQDFIDGAFDRGDKCFAAFDGTRMVSYEWISYSTTPLDNGLWVAFEKPYRYGYKSFTLPEYRGRHLRSQNLPDRFCIERGYRYAIAFIETHNFASIRWAERRNNKVVGFVGYVKLFDKAYPFRSPGAKKHTFRFYRHPDA